MSAVLSAREVEYAQGWALALESAKPADRSLTSIFAMSAVGNLPVVRCATHNLPGARPMTFSAACAHVREMSGGCRLSADVSGLQQ